MLCEEESAGSYEMASCGVAQAPDRVSKWGRTHGAFDHDCSGVSYTLCPLVFKAKRQWSAVKGVGADSITANSVFLESLRKQRGL